MKREIPASFFEEDDDEDYLIQASIENDKENELVSFDDFMTQKPTTSKTDPLTESSKFNQNDQYGFDILEFPDSFDFDNDLEDEELFPKSKSTTQNMIVDAMDYMDISDHESEDKMVNTTTTKNLPKEDNKADYSLVPETGAFVTATCPQTGRNLYFSKISEGRLKKKTNLLVRNLTSGKGKSKGLLSKPLWQLMDDIKKNNLKKTKEIQREINEEKSKKHKRQKVVKEECNQLWVDKYRPTNYMDLMGDQRLNRDVLRWVKQWDFCVFKKKPSEISERDRVMRQYKSTFGTEPKFAAYKKKESIVTNDPLLRPEKKILLMSGPPGFGKTTLAHVIAKQAGYNIIEINASDDRTGSAVKTKIKSALEMQAIIRVDAGNKSMAMSQKPNLIIIDEIDGASSSGGSDSFIKQLVDMASIEIPDEKKKNKSKEKPLMRPIICICNDAYSPVLRPLRMIAQSIVFKKVPIMSIAKRLQTICDLEGLDTDLRSLSMLADLTDGDIRSCLNTLQYIRGKSSVFTKDMIASSGAGSKDMGKSLFSIWDDIFSAPNARHRNSANQTDFDTNKYVDRLNNSILSCGDIDRIMQGCFESYPMMKFHDIALQKFCQMGEWLEFYDTMDKQIHSQFEFGLYKYLSYPIINFHRFFAGTSSQEHNVQYPRVQYEVFSTKKSYENLISIFLSGIHSSKRRYLNKDMVANELVPLLMQIISPDLKITNKQLIKPAEKIKLERLIDIMIEFGLSFKQEKQETGQYVYKLEPPVEQLLSFELSTPKTILPRQYAVRQMIASEIDTEILRRREKASQLLEGQTKKKDVKEIKPSVKVRIEKVAQKQVALDFFGRALVPKVRSEKDKPVKNAKMEVDTPKTNVNYRYHEGFSNAVRKPMTVQMFL